jgi:metal-responsive CopG/Arc/MetJ family transcriptional regulator
MQTNITLSLDNSLIDSVNQYAQSSGQTVSEMLEKQLRRLVREQSAGQRGSLSSRLRGIVTLPEDFDYKKDLEDRAS